MKQGMWAAALWILTVVAYLAIVGIAAGPALELPIRIAAVAAAVAFAIVVAIFWRKIDLALQAELAVVALGAVLAFSGWRLGTLTAANGASILGVSGDVVGAALLLAVLVAVILSALLVPRVPIVVRALVALVLVYPCVPLAVALSHGGGLTESLASNAPLPRDPGWIRGAFVASMVVLPLAAIGMLVAAIVLAVRRRFKGSLRALAAMLALALTSQMSGLEAANAGLPDVLALRGSAATPPAVVAGTDAGSGGLAGAAGIFSGGAAASAAPASGGTAAANPAPASAGAASAGATPLATASSDAASGGGGLSGIGSALGAVSGETSEDLSNSKDRPRWRVGEFLRKLGAAQKYIRHEDFDPAALALTLPNDANALDTFVRDSIGLDDYPGAMRGAKGTLMSRAGNDVDKALLLAELLKDKSIPYRFASSTLSGDDAAALAAATQVSPAVPAEDPPDAFYTELGVTKDQIAKAKASRQAAQTTYVNAGLSYAKARANDLLSAVGNAQVAADDGAGASAFRANGAHLFVQANVGGTWTDLDPSLARIAPGSHLGGATVQTMPALSSDQYRTVRLRYIANFGGADQSLADSTMNVSDVSGTPLSIGAFPDVPNLEDVATASAFTAFTAIGQDSKNGVKFALKDAQGHALTAARVQIDVSGGGAPARSYTRTLWSTGVADAPLALSRTYQMLVVPGSVGASFDSAMTIAAVLASEPLLLYTTLPANERKLPSQSDLAPAYPMELLHYIERDDLFATTLASSGPAPVRFSYDRPDIVMLASGFVRSGSQIRGTTAIDIVENGRRAVASDAAAARFANVERGVLDTSIEAQVLGYLDTTGHGTPQAFAAAKTSNVGIAVVASAGSLPSGVPAQSAAPLRETLAHGQLAYALDGPVTISGESHYAWWAIDPKTGDTVGRMDDGAGDDAVEASALVFWARRAGMAFTLLGCVIAGPSCAEDAEIGIISGGALGGSVAGGVINEVISIFKSLYEIGGGQYGQGAGSGGGGGGDPGAGGPNGDGPPPWDGTWPNI